MRRPLLIVPALLLLGACDLSMRKQPRYDAQAQAPLWSDGSASRPIPAGTVASDDPARAAAEVQPAAVDAAMLARGQDRFQIFCTPCHGERGDGNGRVVQRGFPPPPDYELPRLRAATAQHIYEVISNGYGVMYPYADRISPADRWAIVAYVRALQVARQPPSRANPPAEAAR